MKHFIFILLAISVFTVNTSSQVKITKKLYYSEDYISSIECGTVRYASVLEFVTKSNTHKTGIKYYIVVVCPEMYGANFFKKGSEYQLKISKDYKKITPYFPKSRIESLSKMPNFYLAEEIEIINPMTTNIQGTFEQKSFSGLSKQLDKKCAPNSKSTTFHDIRLKLYDSGKLGFISYKQDTVFILESHDIQGGYRGRIWNKNGFVQYEYGREIGFNFNSENIFTKYTVELVQRWDTLAIREEERLYSNIIPVIFVHSARIIISDKPVIDCFRFKEFFNSKRD